MSEAPVRYALAELVRPSGFRADVRFGEPADEEAQQQVSAPVPSEPAPHQPDPIAEAFAQGYASGFEEARSEAAAAADADAGARDKLALALARLDQAQEEELRLRLRDTVAALCEAAIAPLALDHDLLARRVSVAAGMLARVDDARVIRVHPDDLKLLAPPMLADWDVQPDAALERGSVRVESTAGGVEDGPATWRQAIAQALHPC